MSLFSPAVVHPSELCHCPAPRASTRAPHHRATVFVCILGALPMAVPMLQRHVGTAFVASSSHQQHLQCSEGLRSIPKRGSSTEGGRTRPHQTHGHCRAEVWEQGQAGTLPSAQSQHRSTAGQALTALQEGNIKALLFLPLERIVKFMLTGYSDTFAKYCWLPWCWSEP